MLYSVIVPIYNISDYLHKCINSILNQSYSRLEIILVDDGSTDGCAEICEEYKRKDSRIKLIHKKNGGLVSARKAGASVATGAYIINVDGDDWIDRDYIEKFNNVLKEDDYDIIWSISHKKDYVSYERLWRPDSLCPDRLDELQIQKRLDGIARGGQGYQTDLVLSQWGKAIKRNIYVNSQSMVDEQIRYGEDQACMIYCMYYSSKMCFIDNHGYHYVQRKESMSHTSTMEDVISDDVILKSFSEFFHKHNVAVDGYKRIVSGIYLRGKILHDFSSIQSNELLYLYPFRKIVVGSRIIVFGAGVYGESFVNYLMSDPRFSLIAWVDNFKQGTVIGEWTISDLDDITPESYDYVLIATNKTEFIAEIRRDLNRRGISDERICDLTEL